MNSVSSNQSNYEESDEDNDLNNNDQKKMMTCEYSYFTSKK